MTIPLQNEKAVARPRVRAFSCQEGNEVGREVGAEALVDVADFCHG